MRALVVFESLFGNTETVARAVADGMSVAVPVDVVDVTDAPPSLPEDVTLLVVGGPTQAFSLSRPTTRQDAVSQGGRRRAARTGLREWLSTTDLPPGIGAACFDTRIKKRFVPGSAARSAARVLRRRGVRSIAEPTSFWVDGTRGPLLDGEEERARRWGRTLTATPTAAV